MRKLTRNIAIVVVVIVIVLIALPMFVNVNSFKPRIESELGSALGRKAQVGNLSLSIFGGSIAVENISIADDPAFSSSPFLTAKSLKIGVQLMPLIFSKQLHVTGITFNEPFINVLSNSKGTWNYQSLGRTVPKPESSSSGGPRKPTSSSNAGGFVGFSVAELKVTNGKLIIGKANSPAKPLVMEKVNIEVRNFSAASQFPFTLSALMADNGKLKLDGTAGPLAPAGAPVEAALKLSDLNLAEIGAAPSLGFGGAANLDGTLQSDGKNAKINGTLVLDKLKASPKGTPARQQVTVKFATAYNVASHGGTLSQGDILIGKAVVRLTGRYESQNESTALNLKLDGSGVPVDEIQSILPALGVTLPGNSGLKGGVLSSSLTITGPVDKLIIAGPVRLENSSLTGFDLGGKLNMLSLLNGKVASSSDTQIQSASLHAQVTPQGSNLNNIDLNVPSIGTMTGSGTISPDGALNFHMIANLSGSVGGGLTQIAGLGRKTGGIPFMIEGTASDPKFAPDMKGMTGGAVEEAISGKAGVNTKSPTDALRGLFQKKP